MRCNQLQAKCSSRAERKIPQPVMVQVRRFVALCKRPCLWRSEKEFKS